MSEIISWKKKTFNEISTIIKKNKGDNGAESGKGIFRANPLKIYRRELASDSCNERISLSLDKYNMPGGSITNSKIEKGLTTEINAKLIKVNNKTEVPGTGNCSKKGNCINQEFNARRRVRSSGMIPKKYNALKNNDQYYTSTNQYLASRNRKFDQNQYYNIKQGDATVQPGTNASIFNIYKTNSLNHCSKFGVLSNTSFKYKWIDDNEFEVNIPAGDYEITDIDSKLKNTMTENGHYYIKNDTGVKIFLLSVNYILESNKTQIITNPGGQPNYSTNPNDPTSISGEYRTPNNIFSLEPLFVNPETSKMPQFIFNNNDIASFLGFTGTNYPSDLSDDSKENQIFVSEKQTQISSSYVPIYYKPSNSKFANQGAVESSSRTNRLKYDSITNSTINYRNAYGSEVANALAYGVSSYGYTIKDKIGYPNKCTPKFPKKCYR